MTLGKQESVPVDELLGGPSRSSLDCYATGSDVGAYVDAGFGAVKLPCPWGSDVEAASLLNVDRFANARRMVCLDLPIRVDGRAIQSASDAIALGIALAANTTSEMYYGGPVPEDLMATFRPLPGMGPVVDGTIVPSDAPGFGIELELSDIERATA